MQTRKEQFETADFEEQCRPKNTKSAISEAEDSHMKTETPHRTENEANEALSSSDTEEQSIPTLAKDKNAAPEEIGSSEEKLDTFCDENENTPADANTMPQKISSPECKHADTESVSEGTPEPDNRHESPTETEENSGNSSHEESDVTNTQPMPEPLELGICERLYDFVALFEDSKRTGTAQASTRDNAGGVTKPAIFAHPTATDTARIDYEISLPDVKEKDTKLFLHFSTGLRDGIVFDDAERHPGGVKFAIAISGERCFEAVATECRWTEHAVELTQYARQQIVISFLTECNVAGNSNYAWALWGKPQLLKLRQIPLRKAKGNAAPELYCGIAVVRFSNANVRLLEFSAPDSTPVSQMAADIWKQITETATGVDSEATRPPASQIEALALYAAQPRLEIVSVGATAAVVQTGEDFEVQCTVRNIGAAPLGKADMARLVINGLKLRRGRHTQIIKKLAADEETTISWYARRTVTTMTVKFSVSLKCQTAATEERYNAAGNIAVRPALPKLVSDVLPELHTHLHDGHIVMGNKHLRVIFVCGDGDTRGQKSGNDSIPTARGFEYYTLFVAKGGTYQQVATCPALSEITYVDNKKRQQTLRLKPTDYRLAGNNRGESIIHLNGEHVDEDNVTWNYRGTWILAKNGNRIKTGFQLESSQKRELLSFHGPMLYAAEQNGERKTAALFPGLEFLSGTERSSNRRDAAPPLHNRLVPHPYKITVPLMAVEMQKSVVGIIWNPLDSWDGKNQMLSAIFASPNWHHHQKNTLMGVFLPTVPEWVDENQTVAKTPYPLKAGQVLSIKSELIVERNGTIFDAMEHWRNAYGTPKPLERPRSDVEELLLSRHGFMHTTWDDRAQKSRHCIAWPAQNEPGFGTLLWYDYLATRDESVKERVEAIAKNTCEESGPAGLAARGSCHILGWEFPFYVGHLQAALTHMEAETRQLLEKQESDGNWQWHPTNQKNATLGIPGDTVLGTCASPALTLLKYARITGDKTARKAGLKALAFMKKFTIPRGAQMWECPMYQPDLLAAAHAIGAYVEGYQISRDKAYLKHAEYWANAGLPFLYQWHTPERPSMHFASIPVFGTTFYTHPWFGVPVQWNGLVFAYYLQHLVRVRSTSTKIGNNPWEQIAEGITVSAMYQQSTDDEHKGTYPDGLYEFCTQGRGPHLNPEDIMVNVYTLLGLDPGIKTAILNGIHVSSGARIEALTLNSRTKNLTWNLNYAENQTSYTLIAGYKQAPKAIRTKHQPPPGEKYSSATTSEIPQIQTFETSTSGWHYLKEKDTILIKHLHPTVDVQFELVNT